jgi:hypothetical protein
MKQHCIRRLLVAGALVLSTVAGSACTTEPDDTAPSVELGRHLASIAACHDCHTPLRLGPDGPEPDMARMLSGHPAGLTVDAHPELAAPWAWAGTGTNTAFAGPWGITYAPNLTPHENTGLGIWTEEMFVQAIRTGRHMGQSRPIQPPMPWRSYAEMTDHELRSLYAWLRTIPPVENLVPDYRPPDEIGAVEEPATEP